MLESEKDIILRAIHEIHCTDGDYHRGLEMLCDLIGLKKPYIISNGIYQISIEECNRKED